jgi:hypothetical protein
VPDEKPLSTQIQQWVSLGPTIVAPVTVIGALLFYFGYVSSRSDYAYFGVDVDTIGLDTQGYIMRSPQSPSGSSAGAHTRWSPVPHG